MCPDPPVRSPVELHMRGQLYLCLSFLQIDAHHTNKNKTKFAPDQILHTNLKVYFVNVAWSMVSKTGDKSSKVRAVTAPLSIMTIISLCTFSSADSVA